jgi:hypothetical protein
MIYALISYIIFLAVYDQWSDNSVNWQVSYFVCQYLFAISVSLIEMVRKKSRIYLIIALIFSSRLVIELSCINSSLEEYSAFWQVPPVYFFTFLIIFIFVIYEIYLRWKKV